MLFGISALRTFTSSKRICDMRLVGLFYQIKSLVPRRLQISLRRALAVRKLKKNRAKWPINPVSAKAPKDWNGWADKKKFALLLSHDVDTIGGLGNCLKLMHLEKKQGFRSSFNFVPEAYQVSDRLRSNLEHEGFEVGIHGLKHDGKLFRNRAIFDKRARRINHYFKEWQAVGFRSPAMLHNLEWIVDLDIEYDSSTFDTDPFEPQPDGVETIFPFWISNRSKTRGYVELPYTLPQDHCLFVILKEKDIRIWKEKLDWIAQNGGLTFLDTHPDYMNFDESPCALEQYPVGLYGELLEHIKTNYAGQYWHVLPRELARFWKVSQPSQHHHYVSKPRTETTPRTKIWIDLDNTPNVSFFIPIINELKRRGHKVFLTARDAFQVCELAEKKRLQYQRIGRHYGKNKIMKLIGMLWRSAQMVPYYLSQRPGIVLVHGSRSLLLLGNLFHFPTVLLMDYEYGRNLALCRARWSIWPEAVSGSISHFNKKRTRYFRGIKEDVYVPEFKPDPTMLKELDLRQNDILVAVRPPANEAHYHNPESENLLLELMSRIVQTPGIQAVLLPRNHRQGLTFRTKHAEWFSNNKTIIPSQVLDGLNLIWFSDLVISGGGTMNREAAALGVPVYSIFRGKLGAIDRMLEQEGRLINILNCDDIWTKIRFVKRDKNRRPDNEPRTALEDIVDHIEEIIRIERIKQNHS